MVLRTMYASSRRWPGSTYSMSEGDPLADFLGRVHRPARAVDLRPARSCRASCGGGGRSRRRYCDTSMSPRRHADGVRPRPTIDISPASTLSSCGSSSIEVMRSTWPMRVTRGSVGATVCA